MGIFSRKQHTSATRVVPLGELHRLPDIGRATYLQGQPTDVSVYYLEGFIRAGSPASGSPEFVRFVDQFLGELFDAAVQNPDEWALAGALRAATDFIGSDGMQIPRFVQLVDRALPFMASVGVSAGFIPMFLTDRWQALR